MGKTLIIAEAGVNHNGNINIAKSLIDCASSVGADIVKFQTFSAENLATSNAPKAAYQKEENQEQSQLEMLKELELSPDMHLSLMEYCSLKNIKFLSTAFDLDSIDYLNTLNLNIFKIPSGELTNQPYLQKIGALNKEVILSTGMATLSEIEWAISTLETAGTKKERITLLHCNTAYPTPYKDVNLNAMQTLKTEFGLNIGLSDHSMGIEVPIAAVALGATVIEKHFTLDRDMPGPDHKASLNPDELSAMVSAIRNIEQALGDGAKEPSKSELENIDIARKSIVAIQAIQKGDTFSAENLGIKRPGTGISPTKWDEIIGSTAIKSYKKDELISI